MSLKRMLVIHRVCINASSNTSKSLVIRLVNFRTARSPVPRAPYVRYARQICIPIYTYICICRLYAHFGIPRTLWRHIYVSFMCLAGISGARQIREFNAQNFSNSHERSLHPGKRIHRFSVQTKEGNVAHIDAHKNGQEGTLWRVKWKLKASDFKTTD